MSDVYVGALASEPHLYHHGILGMRWGVRRFQNKDGTLTSRGKARYNNSRSSTSDQVKKERKGLSDRQKKMIKIGATLVVAGLAAYGGYKLAQSGKLDSLINRGSKTLSADKLRELDISVVEPSRIQLNTLEPNRIDLSSGSYSEVKGIKTFSHSETLKESEAKINPFYDSGDPNFNMNCGNCAIAFEARRRGIDAAALGNPKGMTISQMGSFFKGLKSENVSDLRVLTPNVKDADYLAAYKKGGRTAVDAFYRERGSKIREEISKQIASSHPEGSRGCLFVPMEVSSHWVSWEVGKNGKVEFLNGQNPKRDLDFDCFGHYTYHRNNSRVALTAIRYDNLDFAENVNSVIGQSGKKPRYMTDDLSKKERGSNFVMSI